MKIVEVFQTNPFEHEQGGGVRYVRNLVTAFENAPEVESIVFLGQGGGVKKNGKISYIPVAPAGTGYVTFCILLFRYAISKRLIGGGVVHVHRPYFELPFIFFKWLTKCKVVRTLHGRTFEILREEKPKVVQGLSIPFQRAIEMVAFIGTDFLVPVSSDVVRVFSERYPSLWLRKAQAICVIPSMVDTEEFDSSKVNSSSTKKYVCIVGRLSDIKDIPFLVAVVEQNAPYFRKENLKVHVYGEGKKRSDIENLIAKLKLGDIVELKGVVKGLELVGVVNNALATIVCSKHEAGPTIALETLALSTPLISNDVGEVKELLCGPGMGMLVEKKTDSYMAAIKAANEGYEMCASSVQKLRSLRSISSVAKIYIDCFKRLWP